MIGALVTTAALKAPSWNGRTPSSAVKVPSGNTKTDSPLRKNSSISCAWRNRDCGSVRSNLRCPICRKNVPTKGMPPTSIFATKRYGTPSPSIRGNTSK